MPRQRPFQYERSDQYGHGDRNQQRIRPVLHCQQPSAQQINSVPHDEDHQNMERHRSARPHAAPEPYERMDRKPVKQGARHQRHFHQRQPISHAIHVSSYSLVVSKKDGLRSAWLDRPQGLPPLSRLHDLRLQEVARLGAGRGGEPSLLPPRAGSRHQLLRHRRHVLRRRRAKKSPGAR